MPSLLQHPGLKAVRRAAVLGVGLAGTALASGCGSSSPAPTAESAAHPVSATARVVFKSPESRLPTRYPTPKRANVTVGYLNPSGGQESLNAIQEGLTREVTKFGGRVISLDAKLSVDQQVSQFQTMIDRKVDVIAVYAIDPQSLAPLVARAAKAGIPTVALEATLKPDQKLNGFVSQVWLGPDETAYEIAKGVAAAKPHAKVGVMGFAAPVPYIKTIVERIGYWGDQFGLDVVGEADNKDDSVAGGSQAATGLLGRFPSLDAIVTYNEDSALGAYSAVRAAGRQKDIAIFGNNGTSQGLHGVRSGKLAATWQYDAPGAGALVAAAALDAATGVKLPPTVAVPAPRKIDASNVATAKTWEQQLSSGD